MSDLWKFGKTIIFGFGRKSSFMLNYIDDSEILFKTLLMFTYGVFTIIYLFVETLIQVVTN